MEAVSSAAHPPPKWMSGSTQPRGSLLHKKLIEQNLLLLRMLPWMQKCFRDPLPCACSRGIEFEMPANLK